MSRKRRGHSYCAWPARPQTSQGCVVELEKGEAEPATDLAQGMDRVVRFRGGVERC